MPASKLNIWNMALAHLGVGIEVTDENAATKEASACRLFWDRDLEDCLRAAPWPFATRIVALSPIAAVNNDWPFWYRYPANALLINRIPNGTSRIETNESRIKFRIYEDATGRMIGATKGATADAEYNFLQTDPAKFPPDFVTLLSYKLASSIGPRVANDRTKLIARAEKKYEQLVKEAIQRAALEASLDAPNARPYAAPGALSNVYIWNMALTFLGHEYEIESATETSREAMACRRVFDRAVEETLRSFKWPFATRIAVLTEVDPNPYDSEFEFAYRYPADAVTVHRILNGDSRFETNDSKVKYRIMEDATGKILLCDLDVVLDDDEITPIGPEVEYTYRQVDVTKFPPEFVKALAHQIAHQAGPSILKTKGRITASDQAMIDKQTILFTRALIEAQALSANEEVPDREPASEFERARE